MLKNLGKNLFAYIKRQGGMAFPAVLVLLAVGSLIIVPAVRYVATNVNFGIKGGEEFKAILAADAGVEDALWKIMNETPEELPYSYQLADINGFTVDVEIDEISMIAGEPIEKEGTQVDRLLVISGNVTYDEIEGNYAYTLELYSNHNKDIKIEKILIVFPPGVGYVSSSTSSNVTNPVDLDPTVSGSPSTGVTLKWVNDNPRPKVDSYTTEYHMFRLSGPPGMEEDISESYGFVKGQSSDVGFVWINDIFPYTITAEASSGPGETAATIRAGVCGGDGEILSIECWRVIP